MKWKPYSYYINKLTKFLESADVTVIHYADLPEFVVGRYNGDSEPTIWIAGADVQDARGALMTLAHEGGHWLGHKLASEKTHSYQRERQAFVYGWKLLQIVGATPKITRAEWSAWHPELGWNKVEK